MGNSTVALRHNIYDDDEGKKYAMDEDGRQAAAMDEFDDNGNDDDDDNNKGTDGGRRTCKKHRWWALSVGIILLSIAVLAGVLGYYLSGAAAGNNNNDKSSGVSSSLSGAGAEAADGGDDFPGAQIDDFPGASSATDAAGTSPTTKMTAPPTPNPTALPTVPPPTLPPTSPLRPRLVSAIAALMPASSTSTATTTGTTTDTADANMFDPAISRGRAVDWLLDYLSQENKEWMLDLQRQTTAGEEFYLPLPMELRQRYAMGVLYYEGGPHLGLEDDRDGNEDDASAEPDHNYCTWRGITCTTSTSNLVAEIDWEGVNYRGTIPPEIGSMLSTTLRRLGMGTNQLSGTLPTELGALAQLQYLHRCRTVPSSGSSWDAIGWSGPSPPGSGRWRRCRPCRSTTIC